ncbi:MAG TPA: hypothetical protein VKZ60_07650 [Chloroflexota bacterium]|jgi:hypothetical protein|nr:hypothetical protein [Chloroflexota bacterium]
MADYTAPLPDFSRVALQGTFELAGRRYTLQISPLRQFPDYGEHFAVVHLRVVHDDTPLTLVDLGASFSPADCYRLWGALCGAIQAAVREAFALEPRPDAEPNPRLGCWGPRPDLADLGESDCTTAVVLGIAIDTRAARRQPGSVLLAQQLAAAVLRALRGWEAAAAGQERAPRE